MIRLIGFTGAMGSGKSEAIKVLNQMLHEYRLESYLLKFAQPLYDIQEMIYTRIAPVHQRPKDFVKDRKLLQWIGTEWGRDSISNTLWIDLWKAEAVERLSLEQFVLCDDVRFENEAETFKQMGGIIIKLQTTRNKERITTANGIVNHASENGLRSDLVDYVVDNDGTLAEYHTKLNALFAQLLLN